MDIRVALVLACGCWAGLAHGIRITRPVAVLEHTDVKINCSESDLPDQEVNWRYSESEGDMSIHVFRYKSPNASRAFYRWAGRTFIAESFLTLTIKNVTVEDTGYYHCELRGNTYHITRIGSDLTVVVPTSRLHIQPTNATFTDGEDVTLSCTANGIPEPYLRWTDGLTDTETGNREPVQGRSVSLGPLSVSWVDNQKNVTCEAEQHHPLLSRHVIETSVTLNVLYAPRLTIESMVGKSLNLTCKVQANPTCTYIQLTKGNVTLLTTNETESNTVIYTRQSTHPNDTGLYMCVAENVLGPRSASVRLEWNCEKTAECGLEEGPITVNKEADVRRNDIVSYLGIALGGLGVGILALWVVRHVHKRRRTQGGRENEVRLVTSSFADEIEPSPSDPDAVTESVALVDMDDRPPMPLPRPKPRFPKYELSLDRLDIDKSHVIGRGAFGKVYKGTLTEKGKEEPVAIKTLKDNATEEETKLFYEEIGIVIDIGSHGGVLRMRGCCTTDDPTRPLLVMEYMPYGDLLNFLEKCKEVRNGATYGDPMYQLEEKMKYQIGSQVAGGMQYICKQKYIHGDLAARNILVSKGQTIVVKISDFGLTADIYQKGYKRQDPDQLVPYKWISLERLLVNGRCTEKSDVWSFGILLYEVVTLGGPPYPNIHFAEILRDKLSTGWRMEMPEDCSFFMYDCMKSCWKAKPTDRPTFSQLKNKFDNVLLKFFSDYNTVRS
ncbi:fibroblast growth factor receptor 2-like isoform X1 [Branchiostoma lanceolatum]|uniref:fibroblast growth factor receptor 2-like isoform X1 n=2 Tax=Branchiostoma lanceolatum TaxID=7740 RepID=UPI0034533B65